MDPRTANMTLIALASIDTLKAANEISDNRGIELGFEPDTAKFGVVIGSAITLIAMCSDVGLDPVSLIEETLEMIADGSIGFDGNPPQIVKDALDSLGEE